MILKAGVIPFSIFLFSEIHLSGQSGVGEGETYGVELFVQQKLVHNFFYVASYSYVVSKFSRLNQKLIYLSLDNRHLLWLTLGYNLKRNWDLGLKYRYAGGSP